MKTKRLLLAGLLLAIIGIIAVAVCFHAAPEPSYGGKPLSVWFKAYSGVPVQRVKTPPSSGVYFSTNRPAWITSRNHSDWILVSNRVGWYVLSNRSTVITPQTSPATDEPWLAIRAIGSNAVPYLAAQMRHGHWEKFYERNYTNVPALLRKRLPDPYLKAFYRSRAIEIADRLGPAAHETVPAMLELLHDGNKSLLYQLPKALSSVRADKQQIAGVILQLGAERHYAEVVGLLGQFRINDPGVARLLGQMLAGTNQVFHRDAIRLLEGSGARAAPAAPEIIAALKNPDAEVRYLAARSVEMLSQTISPEERPALEQLLRGAREDKSVIVSNVVNRVLARMDSSGQPPPAGN